MHDRTDRTLVIVTCGVKKHRHPRPAGELYLGSFFKLQKQFALTCGDDWLIVSARHGLLDPSAVTRPYHQRLDEQGAITAKQLAAQRHLVDGYGRVITTGGASYTTLLREAFPGVTFERFADLAGLPDKRMGFQGAALLDACRRGTL